MGGASVQQGVECHDVVENVARYFYTFLVMKDAPRYFKDAPVNLQEIAREHARQAVKFTPEIEAAESMLDSL